jgi:hypothetical protein
MSTLIKPGVLAKALNVTTNALRKRRMRDSDPYDYLIDSSTGRSNYILEELPESVRTNVEKITKRGTNRSHEQAMKEDWKYANTLGKVNARRIKIHEDEVAEKAKLQREKEERAALMMKARRDPRKTEKDYVKWTSGYTIGNYWNSIEDYERDKIKKKKKFTGYY